MSESLWTGRTSLGDDLGISTKVLDSWPVTVNAMRNIRAHHGCL
ncbi:hypothetical protein [Olsenella uli]|nr:hypothetical protein [Olsenella uli]